MRFRKRQTTDLYHAFLKSRSTREGARHVPDRCRWLARGIELGETLVRRTLPQAPGARSCSRDLRAFSPKRRETVARFMGIPARIGGGICGHDPGIRYLPFSFPVSRERKWRLRRRGGEDTRRIRGNRIDCPKDSGHSFILVYGPTIVDHFSLSAWLFIPRSPVKGAPTFHGGKQ